MDIVTIAIQLVLSALLGAAVGWEREKLHKAAGYRTLSLVAVGVTLFTQLSQYGFTGTALDGSRIASQVVTGIGFLGAGLIIFHNERVQNLTTAATVWVVAAIGMAVGVGWYAAAVITAVISLVVLLLFRKLYSRPEQQ